MFIERRGELLHGHSVLAALVVDEYFFDKIGGDKNAREVYRDHQYLDDCERFCYRWDQCAFDPEYDTLGLDLTATEAVWMFVVPGAILAGSAVMTALSVRARKELLDARRRFYVGPTASRRGGGLVIGGRF